LALFSSEPVPTMAGVRASQAGVLSTTPAFSATSAAYSTQYRPGAVPSSITATAPAQNRLVPINRRRRSHRSAKTPANGPRTRSGRDSRGPPPPGARQRAGARGAPPRPGARGGAGDQEDGGGDGQREQPRAERADQAARPEQPEVPY